jgi:hypothetical protein
MKSVQQTSFDLPTQKVAFSPFAAMQKVRIDEVLCYVAKSFSALVVLIGLMCVLNGAIQEGKREDKIEELIYRKGEEDEMFEQSTPTFTDYQRKITSRNQRRMIIRDALRRKWDSDRIWRRRIANELKMAS